MVAKTPARSLKTPAHLLRKLSSRTGVTLVLAISCLTMATLATAQSGDSEPGSTAAIADARRLGDAFSTVAEKVSPSVVSIRVEVSQPEAQVPFFFFGNPNGARPPSGLREGAGSGVIIGADGHILTNNHVVEKASRIDVHLQDGRRFPAKTVGVDPATDLAVIKIDATGLTPIPFGSSDKARVGEFVIAIGSPFGLNYSVTTGVLSAKGRAGLGANEIEDYLQTDASINPGNSGGPLVNLEGEVLGINTMIIGRGAGIGFAVPSDLARNVARQLIDNGEVRRAWIGVTFQPMTPELAHHLTNNRRGGALISNVVDDAPADKAGLKPGDVVVSVDGVPIREGHDLLREIIRKPVGGQARLEVLRNGKSQKFSLRLAERPNADGESDDSKTKKPGRPLPSNDLGLGMTPLTPQIRNQLRYAGTGKVTIDHVAPGSRADRSGLQRGDIIVEADRKKVETPDDVTKALRDGTALLRVERGSSGFYTVLKKD